MPTRSERDGCSRRTPREDRSPPSTSILTGLLLTLAGCGEPSARELKNRQEFEALLTAIALQNTGELEKDARRLDDRLASGELSDKAYKELQEIIRRRRLATGQGPRRKRTHSARPSPTSSDPREGLVADEDLGIASAADRRDRSAPPACHGGLAFPPASDPASRPDLFHRSKVDPRAIPGASSRST